MPRNTVGIVDRIKCETTWALVDEIKEKLRHNDLKGQEATAAAELADRIAHEPLTLQNFKPEMLTGAKAKAFYKRYINIGIAYDFSLTGMEENSISGEVDFARVVTNGMVSVPLAASNDRMRQSARTFTITETFQSLLNHIDMCQMAADEPNFIYPVSGHIGIYDIIHTFVDLNEEKDLTPKTGAPALYTDALTFTTTTIGGMVPTRLVLTPPTRPFHLTGAMLTNTETRKDTDVVTIGLSLPPKKGEASAKASKEAAKEAIVINRNVQFQNTLIQFFSTR